MRRIITPFLPLLLVIIIFHSWFMPGLLTSFDFPYYSQLMMKNASINLYAWDWHIGFDGFAGFFSPYSWVYPFINFPQVIFGNYLGLDWAVIERIIYLYPLLTLFIFSPILLLNYFFPENKFYLISILIFSLNTYALLLAGGEIFIALTYALAPVVFISFVKIIDLVVQKKAVTKYSILAGIVLSIQIMLDPRISYVTMFVVGLYFIFILLYYFSIKRIFNFLYLIFYLFIIPWFITALLNAFWIVPTVIYGKNPVGELGASYSTTEAVRYLSFARLEQTLSLLHPNWPENIFGKIYFMKPEFLLIPIVAFASLFFINNKQNMENQKHKKYIIFFAFLGLLGAFLAKGVNDPFGGIYLWLFDHVPGFIMFRDPAKWYLLIAISYSILIPFTVWEIYEYLKLKFLKYKYINYLFLTFIILYLIFIIRPAISNQPGGMYKTTKIPSEYAKLEKYLYDQPDYFRTFWFPARQHFGYYSTIHPEISAQTLFNIYDYKKLLQKMSSPETQLLLQEASIKYIIIPYDSEKEIFITDRKYDDAKYQNAINYLENIKWLKPVSLPRNCTISKSNCLFDKIAVFELSGSKDHFWSNSAKININYKFVNQTKYLIKIKNANVGDKIIFTEKFDKGWIAKNLDKNSFDVVNIKYGNYNSFILPGKGDYELEVDFVYQKWVDIGIAVSVFSLFLSLIWVLFLIFKKINQPANKV